MSTFERNRRTSRPQPLGPHDAAMLRAVGVVVLLAIGAMHFLQIVTTIKATPALGLAYLVFIGACVGLAAALVVGDELRTWAASGGVCVAALGGYAFTRLIGTPFDNQDVGNWSCMLGLAALFVETTMVALSVYALAVRRSSADAALATGRVTTAREIVRNASPFERATRN